MSSVTDGIQPWYGHPPAHWATKRLKFSVSACQNGTWGEEPDGGPDDLPCVRVADFDRQRAIVEAPVPTLRKVTLSEREGRLLCDGDLLLEKSGGGEQQPVGFVVLYAGPTPAVCSNFVARMPPHEGAEPRFFRYVHSTLYALGLNRRSIKQTTGIQNLDSAAYLNERVPFPPLAEQSAIAEFLDRKTAAIDAVIVKKQRVIALLNEKRRAARSAVAMWGSVDGAPPTLSAPIPLRTGDGWNIVRVKHCITRLEQGWSPQCDNQPAEEGCWGVLKTGCVNGGVFRDTENKALPLTVEPLPRLEVHPGDVIVSRANGTPEYVGSAALVRACRPKLMLSDKLFRLTPKRAVITPEFLVLALGSRFARHQIEGAISGAEGLANNIGQDVLLNLRIALPPLDAQRRMVGDLEKAEQRLHDLVDRLRRSVNAHEQYRKVLIAEAVTGRLSISGVASQRENSSECVVLREDNAPPRSPHRSVPKANPFFRRAVLAAEIVHRLHSQPTFGRVKFQKLLFLAEHHLRLPDVQSQYRRAAAGPLDRKLMFSVEGQLERGRWYKANTEGGRTSYVPLEKAGHHREYWPRYWGEYQEQFNRLMALMSASWMDTEHAEMIATLYAVWNDFLIRNEDPDDDLIVREVLTNWNSSKQRIGEDRWRKALAWMKQEGLVPHGHGRPTDHGGSSD